MVGRGLSHKDPRTGPGVAGVERARAYLAAGADCVYPILIRSPVKSFVDAVGGAVNVALLPEFSVPDLAAVGVARISLGPGLWRRTQALLREIMGGLRHSP